MSFVTTSLTYFADPTKGTPVFHGKIFVGDPDTDPEIEANQKQASLRLEDGSTIQVGQPVSLGPGGVVTYQGSYAILLVDGDFSLKVLNRNDTQVYYIPNNAGLLDASEISYKTITVEQRLDNLDVDDYDELRALDSSTVSPGDNINVTSPADGLLFGPGTVIDNGSPRTQIYGLEEPFTDNPNIFWRRNQYQVYTVDWFIDPSEGDDSIGIQRAIDAMPNAGCTILFSSKVYNLNTRVQVSAKRGMHLFGIGNGDGVRTTLQFSDQASEMLNFTTCKGCEIKGFSLRSDAVGTPLSTGLDFGTQCSEIVVHQNLITNFNFGIDINGAFASYYCHNTFGGNNTSIITRAGANSVWNQIHANTFGDHTATTPVLDLRADKTFVYANAFECNTEESIKYRIMHVVGNAQDNKITNNNILSNASAGTPNGCGGVLSDSPSTVFVDNEMIGVTNVALGEGLIQGRFAKICNNTFSGDPAVNVLAILLNNDLQRTPITGNRFLNFDNCIDFSDGEGYIITGNMFSGITGELFRQIGADTTIKANHFHNFTGTIGTTINLNGCEIEYIPTVITLAQDASAPSVLGARKVETNNTVVTGLNNLTLGYDGQRVVVYINDSNTNVDFTASNLRGNGGVDWSPNNGDYMVCENRSGVWYCNVVDTTV